MIIQVGLDQVVLVNEWLTRIDHSSWRVYFPVYDNRYCRKYDEEKNVEKDEIAISAIRARLYWLVVLVSRRAGSIIPAASARPCSSISVFGHLLLPTGGGLPIFRHRLRIQTEDFTPSSLYFPLICFSLSIFGKLQQFSLIFCITILLPYSFLIYHVPQYQLK